MCTQNLLQKNWGSIRRARSKHITDSRLFETERTHTGVHRKTATEGPCRLPS